VDKFLTFGIVGLSLAAIYAVMASGLVVTYTTTGIFNFAHGAIGMLAAFAYWQLRVAWGWPAPIAIAMVLLVLAPGFGLFLEWLIMRRIRELSDAVKLVVSIALLTALISTARWIWDPSKPRTLRKFFASSKPIHVGPTTITMHQLITLGVAVVVAVGLRIVMYRTRIGVAMRAAVDDPSLSVLNGARPEIAAKMAWALGSFLAAVGGILIAPNVALDAGTLSLLILSAYAAAVVGRLRSVPMAFLGAVIVGCTESYLAGYLPRSPYLTTMRLASPAIILFVVLLVLPQNKLKSRVRSRESFPVPKWRGAIMFAVGVTFAGIVLATTLGESDQITYGRMFSIALIALSLVPLVGYTGQISLCQMTLAGIGAVVYSHLGQGTLLSLVLAMVVPAAVGVVIALPALRLSGIYLALGTAAFAMMVDKWVFTVPPLKVFGLFKVSFFSEGSLEVPPLRVFGTTISTSASQTILAAALFSATCLVVVALRRSFFGRRLIAIRDSEAACATLGGNLVVAKMSVFAISAAIAGLGGAVWSMQSGTISGNYFDFITGLQIFVVAVVGGIAKLGGALFAGAALAGVLPVMVALAPSLENVAALMPGLAGVGLGQSPNGAVGDLRKRWDDILATRVMTVVFAAFVVGWYALRMMNVTTNWPFVIGLAIGSVLIRTIATIHAYHTRNQGRIKLVPMEWRGISEPWTEEDGRMIEWGMAWAAREQAGRA
jgi:branched-chain amino acid transport system permease protein